MTDVYSQEHPWIKPKGDERGAKSLMENLIAKTTYLRDNLPAS